MKELTFIDNAHVNFYSEHSKENDVYKNSLVYLIGLTEDTRNHFSEILTQDGINLDVFNNGWITGETRRLLILGFNLWNGYLYGSENNEKNTSLNAVDEIFSGELAYYFLQAVNIRFDIEKKQQRLNELEDTL